jgi:hypothetical protein
MIFLFLSCVLRVNAQFVNKMIAEKLLTRLTQNIAIDLDAYGYEIEGSPYLNDSLVDGVISVNNGRYPHIAMRYNIYRDQIEFLQDQILYALLPDRAIRKIELGEIKLVVEPYEFKGKVKNGYFNLLDSGKASLFSKPVVIYKEREEQKAMQYEASKSKYIRLSDKYYCKVGKQQVVMIENMKDLLAVLSDKEVQLKQFIAKNKIANKSEKDFIRVVGEYNTLSAND